MLFTVAAHTNTKWILGMVALGCVLSTLLSMIFLWAGLGLWGALTWSIYQISQGQSSWFGQLIPKQTNTLTVSWNASSTDTTLDASPNDSEKQSGVHEHVHDHEATTEATTIHVYTNPIHQWWAHSAFFILGTALLGWFSIYSGWVPIALGVLGILSIAGAFGHKDQPEEQSTHSPNHRPSNTITLDIPPETSWMGLHTWLRNHQVVLPTTGTIVLHPSNTSTTIPFVLPVGFTEWTVQSESPPNAA